MLVVTIVLLLLQRIQLAARQAADAASMMLYLRSRQLGLPALKRRRASDAFVATAQAAPRLGRQREGPAVAPWSPRSPLLPAESGRLRQSQAASPAPLLLVQVFKQLRRNLRRGRRGGGGDDDGRLACRGATMSRSAAPPATWPWPSAAPAPSRSPYSWLRRRLLHGRHGARMSCAQVRLPPLTNPAQQPRERRRTLRLHSGGQRRGADAVWGFPLFGVQRGKLRSFATPGAAGPEPGSAW